jgi:hypothetical protein
MDTSTKKQIERQLKNFTSRNFIAPSECRNADQIRFYIEELCRMIMEMKKSFNYVPAVAYVLLSQYNARQNAMVHTEFRKTYR